MKIVRFDKQAVTVGLNWHMVEEQNERKAIAIALKDEVKYASAASGDEKNNRKKIKKVCVVKNTDMCSVGFWVTGLKIKGSLGPSGAALLGVANQNRTNTSGMQSSGLEDDVWLLVERLGDDEYWVVFINKGLPMPGGDILSTKEGVRSFLGQDGLLELPLKLFTTDLDVQDFAPPKAQVVSQGFLELTKGVKPSRGALKQATGVDPVVIAIIGGFLVLVGGFFGWSSYDKAQKTKAAQLAASNEAAKQNQQIEAEKKSYVDGVRQAVLTALDQGVASVDSALSVPATQELVTAWIDMTKSVPLEHSGFDLTRIECVLETPEQPLCTVFLTRGEWGVNRIFLQDFPQATLIGNDATYSLRGPILLKKEPNWKGLPSADKFNMGLVSDLQIISKIGVSFNQTASQDIVQAITLPPPPAEILSRMDPNAVNIEPPPVNLGVAKGNLTLTGQGTWQAEGVGIDLDRAGISALSMNLAFEGSSWQMQFDYFIRTLPSPQLPTVLGPDGPIVTAFPEKYRHLTAGEATGSLVEVSVVSEAEARAKAEAEALNEVKRPEDEDIKIGLPSSQ